jgi:hypothetical protein
MGLPVTDQERKQACLTQQCAGPTENLVSTACPACNVRFALLVHFYSDVHKLRCTICGWTGNGELKGTRS